MFKSFNLKKLSVVLTTMCCVIFAMTLVFNSCKKEDESDSKRFKAGGISQVVWKGESDKAVAVDIDYKVSTRTKASGPKITSNAHSADFPGIYFIWDSKQKDNGYLKVAAEVFDVYEGFTLTSKESNKYFDFNIQVQADQQMTDDFCYVFYIPKVYNNKNINMVFVSGYLDREIPNIPEPPIIEERECINTYTMISGANDNGVVIDPNNSWTGNGNFNPHIKAVWNNAISGSPYYSAMTGITANGKSAQWIWNRMDSWEYGFTGSNLINTVSEFNLQGTIMENEVPFYFACDNAAVLFVNGTRVGWTTVSLEDKEVPNNEVTGFEDFSHNAFNGEVWQYLYMVDIKEYLWQGANRIVLVAANSDENNGRWNKDNNPAGLIYACQFNTNKCGE